MPKLLELTEFAHGNGVPKMKVGGGGVVTAINAQGLARLFGLDQALAQLFRQAVGNGRVAKISALHQIFNLFIDVHLYLLHGQISACDRIS